jgi:hypothetical protein
MKDALTCGFLPRKSVVGQSDGPMRGGNSGPFQRLLEGEAGDIGRRQIQLVAGNLMEHIARVKRAGAGAFENRREPRGGLVNDLGYFQDLLSASHDASTTDGRQFWLSSSQADWRSR